MKTSAPAVLSFVGESGSGKTTVIESVIRSLGGFGLKVAALKHSGEEFHTDLPGKDTRRFYDAGASAAAVLSDGEIGFSARLPEPLTAAVAAAKYFPDADIVLAEGFKKEPLPKIVVGKMPAVPSAEVIYSTNFSAGLSGEETEKLTALVFIFYALSKRHALVGIGNPLKGDDAFGPELASRARLLGYNAFDAGAAPENYSGKILDGNPETVVIFDAVVSERRPGAVGVFGIKELPSSAPSTHGTGLGMFADYVSSQSGARLAVVGVRPSALAVGDAMSPPVASSLSGLSDFLTRMQQCTNWLAQRNSSPR